MEVVLIGDVSRKTGFPATTIRYYEEIGLLEKPARASSGYRAYSPHAVDELLFIKKAQGLGFSLEEIAEILQLSRSGQRPCERVLALSHKHLDAISRRIRELQRFKSYLAAEARKWDRKKTSIRCDGLCQFIADAEPSGITLDARKPFPAAPKGRRRSR